MDEERINNIISWLEHQIYQNTQYGLGNSAQTSMYQSIIALIQSLTKRVKKLEAKK